VRRLRAGAATVISGRVDERRRLSVVEVSPSQNVRPFGMRGRSNVAPTRRKDVGAEMNLVTGPGKSSHESS